MGTLTIKSNTTICYKHGLENYKKGYDIINNSYAMKKNIVYRRYVFGEDNLSGDKNFADYNDYNITAEIQIEAKTKDVQGQGYIISAYGFIYLPAIISSDVDNTGLPSFRPQIKDEFQFNNKWYIIQNIQPTQFSNNPMGMECLFKLISTGENPR